MKKILFSLVWWVAIAGLMAQATPDTLQTRSKSDNEQAFAYFPSNYFVGNSSFSLPKGEGYYANTLLFFNDFYYGVTDHFSVGAGLMPTFLFQSSVFPVWLKAKVAYPLADKFRISGGFTTLFVFQSERDPLTPGTVVLGFPFVGATYGTAGHNVSANLHWGFLLNDVSNGSSEPILSLATKQQITPRTHFILDAYLPLVQNEEVFLFAITGLQTAFVGLSLDYGLMIPLYSGEYYRFVAFPYLGVKIPFRL